MVLVIWCTARRFMKDGKIEEQPLGMPRGTVRAFITLLIISFPFNYLLTGEEIPSLIINAIFILVAFYFQARKSGKDKLKRIIKQIKNPEKYVAKEEKKPLYLPKFSVRVLLLIMLTAIIIINIFRPTVPFESTITNTLVDLLIIICLFVVGAFFRGIGNYREKKKIKNQIINMRDYQSLTKYEILENLIDEKPSWWRQKGKSFLSMLILLAAITSLLCYTVNWDYSVGITSFFELSFRETLLLLINLYYGFRD